MQEAGDHRAVHLGSDEAQLGPLVEELGDLGQEARQRGRVRLLAQDHHHQRPVLDIGVEGGLEQHLDP